MHATFSWKPVLVGSRFEVRVDKAWAEATRGSKTRKVRFADVTGGRLLELSMRTSSVSLVLMHTGKDGNGKFVINHGGRISDASHDENAAAFVAASAEVLENLAAARPEVQLDLGGGVGLRAVMAVLGVIMALLGVAVGLIPFGQGAAGFETALVVLMAILIVVGGVGLAMRYSPFAKLETISAAELARVMRSHLPKC
jgi:hypothetical protein